MNGICGQRIIRTIRNDKSKSNSERIRRGLLRQWVSLKLERCIALLSQEGSGIAKRYPTSGEGGWFRGNLCKDAALEPPPARSRLRLNRAALLTQEGNTPL